MPPTTNPDLKEMQRVHKTVHAVSELFTAIAAHSATVSVSAELAVRSHDLRAIQSLTRLLESMSTTLQGRKPQLPLPPRRRMDS